MMSMPCGRILSIALDIDEALLDWSLSPYTRHNNRDDAFKALILMIEALAYGGAHDHSISCSLL